ncbi:hypothetical protein D3C78_1062490 [compost metagenome]
MGNAGHLGAQVDFTVLAQGKAQFVAMVEKLEEGLQLVITIGAAAEDVQHQVELGRGRQDELRVLHHWPSWRGCQSLITRVMSRFSPCSLMRSGRE